MRDVHDERPQYSAVQWVRAARSRFVIDHLVTYEQLAGFMRLDDLPDLSSRSHRMPAIAYGWDLGFQVPAFGFEL